MTVHQHTRGKLVKTHKNVLPQKQIVADEVCRETYSKNVIKWSRKRATDIPPPPPKKRGMQRERVREGKTESIIEFSP